MRIRLFFVRMIGSNERVYRLFAGFPIPPESNVIFFRQLSGCAGWRCVGIDSHFPPTLPAMIVLMIDREAGALQHWADPPNAVIAVIVILLELVAEQKTF